MKGFHAHDGWWFEGLPGGSVIVTSADGHKEATFSADTWASIVREVRAQVRQREAGSPDTGRVENMLYAADAPDGTPEDVREAGETDA